MDSLLDIELFRNVWGVAIAVLFFGATVFVHELGHFLAAKKRGLKVERFSIGFGPRVWGWTGRDGVDYRLSLFPLGGYVALPQMADMSAVEGGTEDDAERLPKIGYADKMIVAVMGAVFNVLFACVLACVLWLWGMPEPQDLPVIGGVDKELVVNAKGEKHESPASKAGLRVGDRITSVDGRPVSGFSDIMNALILGSGRDADGRPLAILTIERQGKPLPEPVRLNPIAADRDGDSRRMIGIRPSFPIIVDVSKDPNSVAAKAGLKTGDRVIAVNNLEIWSFEQFRDAVAAVPSFNDTAQFRIERKVDDKPVMLDVTVVPEARKVRNATVVLEFADGDVRRTVELVPGPAEAEFTDKAFRAPRTALMVCDPPSSEASQAAALPVGTIVYGVSGPKGGVMQRTADLEAFVKVVNDAQGGDLTLFLRDDSKDFNLVLSKATARVKEPEMRKTVDGVAPRYEAGKPVHRAPWYYLGETFSTTARTLAALFSPGSDVGLRHMSGVIGIARIYVNIADSLRSLFMFTILINVNLAILNLMPLPVLDGGHMVYATLEKIRGRPLPLRVVEILQISFVVILFGLMAYVLSQDIRRMNSGGNEVREQFVKELVNMDPAALAKK